MGIASWILSQVDERDRIGREARASGCARRPRGERIPRRGHLKGFLLKAPQALTDILSLILTSQSYLAVDYINLIQLTLIQLTLKAHLTSCWLYRPQLQLQPSESTVVKEAGCLELSARKRKAHAA
jgi:hypothetical protein